MPYIKQHKRDLLDPAINDLHKAIVNLQLDDESDVMEGNLNYTFTKLLRMCYNSDNYSEINDAVGVLSCVLQEHYRTMAMPLEDQKRYDNGDVSGISSKSETLPETVVVQQSK